MNYQTFIGIDISKKTLDVSVRHQNEDRQWHRQFANTRTGYRDLVRWLKKKNVTLKQALICMENTGLYHRKLVEYLYTYHVSLWLETPVQIKWSMGIHRGKTDKADAGRIREYAERHHQKARLYSPREQSVEQLADLVSLRDRLVNTLTILRTSLQEYGDVGLHKQMRHLYSSCRRSIAALEKDIAMVKQKIEKIIAEHDTLSQLYKYISSVIGVGFVATVKLIIYTDGFTRFDNAKQLASYAGVAPFPYQSGTSIKGRTKVHTMANKVLKAVLHMCAMSAIRCDPSIKTYYQRKVLDGKNKMSVINAVRNKLIHRVFACVRDKKLYDYNFSIS